MADEQKAIPGSGLFDGEPYSIKRGYVTLTNCDREPVQMPGCVQAHGALLVLRPADLTIVQATENTSELLGSSPAELLGKTFGNAFGSDAAARLKQALESETPERHPLHVLTLPRDAQRPPLVVTMHTLAGSVILEYEPEVEPLSEAPDCNRLLRETLGRIRATNGPLELSEIATREIRELTGFDRVMIYRFHPDGSGEVVAESCPDALPSWLGLRYPAADIPSPARDIYRRSWVRCVPNVAGTLAELVPLVNPETGQPLEMIHCALRGPSVMYTEYLANIQVHASMTMSIRRDEHLWGMIACHHHAGPKPVPYWMRTVCAVFAQVFSLLHHAAERREELDHRLHLDRLHERLVERARGPDGAPSVFSSMLEGEPSLATGIAAEGVAIFHQGQWSRAGATPPEDALDALAQWLEVRRGGEPDAHVYATDVLAHEYPPAGEYGDRAAGVLMLAIDQPQRVVVAWFRPETVKTVRWRGNPYAKPRVTGPHGDRLTPRRSFELWQESVRGRSIPWTRGEIEAAARLHAMLERRVFEDAVRAADRQKDVFIATLAHELRNPLAPLRTGLDLLQALRGDAAASEEPIRIMDRQLVHLVRLVDDLLDVSRISRGKIQLREERLDLAEIVHAALVMSESGLSQGERQLRIDLPSQPLFVAGDRVRLVQVIANLLNNAVKFTDTGGRIEVRVTPQGERVEIQVQDDGRGIPRDRLDHIFEMFLQAEPGHGGGLGIGLALVRGLVELHGGTARAESAGPGYGATFTVSLPLCQSTPVQSTADRPMAFQALPPQLRILVVDDNRDIVEGLDLLLTILGATVRVAHDGVEALRVFDEWLPTHVLMDLGMPGMDGYEAARRLRAKHPDESFRLIAVTGWGQEEDRDRTREAGFDEHLVKPVGVAELKAVLSG